MAIKSPKLGMASIVKVNGKHNTIAIVPVNPGIAPKRIPVITPINNNTTLNGVRNVANPCNKSSIIISPSPPIVSQYNPLEVSI
jgi:hypothetical protein